MFEPPDNEWIKGSHWLTSALLGCVPGIVHGFSCNLHAIPGNHEPGFDIQIVSTAEQVHSNRVEIIGPDVPPVPIPGADGLVTSSRNIALGIRTADCVPLLLAHKNGKCIAAAHAGWRGTLKNIASEAVKKMCSLLSCPAGELIACIGPAIGPCCFEVGENVARDFEGRIGRAVVSRGADRKMRVDLLKANRIELERAGLEGRHIETISLCTMCRADLFPSYRRNPSEVTEKGSRIWSLIVRKG